MQALIVDKDIDRQERISIALMRLGFQIRSTGCVNVAESCIRSGVVDLLVMTERVEKRLTHALALLAECRNPLVATMLLTARTDADVDELFLLLPSLHSLVAPDISAELIAKLAVAAVSDQVRVDRPVILPSSMQIAGTGATPVFSSVRAPNAPDKYLEIDEVA